MLAKIISPVRKRTLRRVCKLVAWFYLILAGMAVNAEGFLMAGSAGLAGAAGIKAMFFVKIESFMVHGAVRVGMTFGTVGHPFDCFRVNDCYALCVRAGIEKKKDHWHGQYYQDFIFHSCPSLR